MPFSLWCSLEHSVDVGDPSSSDSLSSNEDCGLENRLRRCELDDPEDETDGDDSGEEESELVLFGVSLGSMLCMRLLIFGKDFLVFFFFGLQW